MNRFLYFSRGQQVGIIVLLVCIVLLVAVNALLPRLVTPEVDVCDSTYVAQVAEFENSLRNKPRQSWQSPFEGKRESDNVYAKTQDKQLFAFDPNTLDSAGFVRLGIKPYIAKNILKYRANGGAFRSADDFGKIYGITPEQLTELRPYIAIQTKVEPKSEVDKSVIEQKTRKEYVHLELNSADTTELQRMPGIGSGRARQIVGYRKRLGGFYATSQLLEIKNFPPDVYQKMAAYLSVDQSAITKIAINKASVDRMKNHPYLNFYQAKAIYDYRYANGQILSVDVLKQMSEFDNYDFEKLLPYIDFSEVKREYKRR